MKNFLVLLFVIAFSHHSFAQLRIEKRHYNRGWYVSLRHSQKRQINVVASGEEKTDSVIAFQSSVETLLLDSIVSKEEAPEAIQSAALNPVKQNHPAKKTTNTTQQIVKEEIAAPVAAPLHLAQQSIRQSRSLQTSSAASYGDWDALLLFGKILLWILVLLFLIGILLEIISYFLVSPWLGVAAVVVFIGCLFL